MKVKKGFTEKVMSQMGLKWIHRDGLEKGEWMAFIPGSDPGHKGAQSKRVQGRLISAQ